MFLVRVFTKASSGSWFVELHSPHKMHSLFVLQEYLLVFDRGMQRTLREVIANIANFSYLAALVCFFQWILGADFIRQMDHSTLQRGK